MMKKALLSLLLVLAVSAVALPAKDEAVQVPGDARQVAELLSDTYSGETILLVRLMGEVELDAGLWLRARDGAWVERIEAAHVFGSYIVLKEKVRRDYLIGSYLYQ